MLPKERTRKEKEKKSWLKNLGIHIKELRLERKMTAISFGKQLSMDRSNVRRLERGDTNPSSYLIKRISEEIFEISLKEFWTKFEERK